MVPAVDPPTLCPRCNSERPAEQVVCGPCVMTAIERHNTRLGFDMRAREIARQAFYAHRREARAEAGAGPG